MTNSLLDVFKTIVSTFSGFYNLLSTPINELIGINVLSDDITVITFMFGAGLVVFVVAVLVKWFVP